MRSFRQHKLIVEFVENLLEFDIKEREPGSLGTWSSKGFETAKSVKGNWIIDGLAGHGITLDLNSVFKVINAPTNSPFIIIGGGTVEDVKAWTELSDGPEGTAIATIGWSKIRKGLFKDIEVKLNFDEIKSVKLDISEGFNPRRRIALVLKGRKKPLPLSGAGELKPLLQVEEEGARLAKFLDVNLEGLK